ncbi:zinc-dependent alcohol dehydrogenase family protein [Permianibacter aggregans]|uniref:NADPH:quinone reductase-like Zn-dependent oxidoreductase n=1 Tax=Permianibacter aggregans TaxID=1510150 RepID=A0A4V6PWN7_9GAMM|nr:NAD(P)-dependent alcohol dehydrogenase [Permianibacter aggregans]QGX39834.1 NAD(P)-dependent alcohol dehydrogenase [Permianibacter aggregans]TDQ45927.1 NADPH:quinone reductase-like Zn-dependent oxidoreductase [Permianibacter aggregans]
MNAPALKLTPYTQANQAASTYHGYRLRRDGGIESLGQFSAALPPLAEHEVQVRIRAVSLNHRDLLIAGDGSKPGEPVIPVSDGAGEVIAVGSKVKQWQPGDRVMLSFFPDWVDGIAEPSKIQRAFGGSIDGLLRDVAHANEHALVRIPEHLSFEQAATLPCAGLTAWNALLTEGQAQAGDTVVLLGTGGVSVWALQLAKAAGLKVFITSSQDHKLAWAKRQGAEVGINYRDTPEWSKEVLRHTDGLGVKLVLDVGGKNTLNQAIDSIQMGGTVALIGGVSGGFGGELAPLALSAGKKLVGIMVGSRAQLAQLAEFVSQHAIQPVLDKTFPFSEAKQAYRYLASGEHIGKVVITLY